jgi:CheY-like chemotaxis protein
MKLSEPRSKPTANHTSSVNFAISKSRIKQVIRRACMEAERSDIQTNKQQAQKNFSSMKPPVILLAEDDKEMRTMLAQELRISGYRVAECPDGWNLLEQLGSFVLPNPIEHEEVDLVIFDIRMPGITGLEILEGLHQAEGFPPIILITAFGDEKTHLQEEECGAAAMFDKPFEIDDLLAKVRKIMPLSK